MGVGRRTQRAMSILAMAAWLALLLAVPAPVRGDTGWRAEIFTNPHLAGTPALVRTDPAVDFDWGAGSPDPRIPPDQFSIRWTGSISLEAGTYRFATLTDDGVRLYVDGHLVIDQWRETAPAVSLADLDLVAGFHQVRMEYYEASGGAVARLSWSRLPDASRPVEAWRGEYYGGPMPWGTPALVREDAKIDFNWGKGSPDARIPVDGFSVRWMRDLYFDAGTYRFTTETDDGVRLFLDDRPILDAWRDMSGSLSVQVWVDAGKRVVCMEYYERSGGAKAKLFWRGASDTMAVGNLITCVGVCDSWIKVYQRMADGSWQDIKPEGWGAMDVTGYLKIDGLPVDTLLYGDEGHPYRVELWSQGRLVRSVGHTEAGQPPFVIRAGADNVTPWQCPAL